MKSVLVFDSGVGGLSILNEIATVLPNQHFIYAFDNEAFPYGELADEVLISRVCAMINVICQQYDIALVVIACNTASTLVLPPLRELLSIPVVGVVPAIKPASLMSKTKKIGLLATPATIRRSYTLQLVREFAPDCDVSLLGSTELVLMAEAKLRGITPDKKQLKEILSPFINNVDVVILGCTHFPLLKEEIEDVMGNSCDVIDSGKAIAQRVQSLLAEQINNENVNVAHIAMSSASVSKEEQLNQHLSLKGFNSIIRCPTF